LGDSAGGGSGDWAVLCAECPPDGLKRVPFGISGRNYWLKRAVR